MSLPEAIPIFERKGVKVVYSASTDAYALLVDRLVEIHRSRKGKMVTTTETREQYKIEGATEDYAMREAFKIAYPEKS